MTNRKTTKRALFTSTLALLMCVAMLIGTTFAWFTDSASTSVNEIKSGNLDLVVEVAKAFDILGVPTEWEAVNSDTALYTNVEGNAILWEPGAGAEEWFRITNNGTLAFKYQFKTNYTNATKTAAHKTLADILKVQNIAMTLGSGTDASVNYNGRLQMADITGSADASTGFAPMQNVTFEEYLLPGESRVLYTCIEWLPTDNDNDFNVEDGLKIDLGISVMATQYTYEKDAESDQYDAGALYPNAVHVADGVAFVAETNTYEISSVAGLNWFNDEVNNHHNDFNYTTIKLMSDINMGGATWLPVGQNYSTKDYPALGYADTVEFRGIFDGNGKTISNIEIGMTAVQVSTLDDVTDEITDQDINSVGFFGYTRGTIKNLTLDSATVTGFHNVGAIVGYTDVDSYIENCHVKNSTISCTHLNDDQCGDKAGGIVGLLNNNVDGADIKGCTVANTAITAGRDAGQVIGCAQSGSSFENCTAINVTVSAIASGATGACTDSSAGDNINNNNIIGRDLRS